MCDRELADEIELKLGRCESCGGEVNIEVLDALKAWRRELAVAGKVPPYTVFTDLTLLGIAERMPTSDAHLVAIPGIGAAKLMKYGADVLAIVAGRGPVGEITAGRK